MSGCDRPGCGPTDADRELAETLFWAIWKVAAAEREDDAPGNWIDSWSIAVAHALAQHREAAAEDAS